MRPPDSFCKIGLRLLGHHVYLITSAVTKVQRLPLFRNSINGENRKSTSAVIMLSIFLAVTIAALFANNVLGVLAVLAAPFWLPLCCHFVPINVVRIYLGMSLAWLFLSLPVVILGNSLSLPKGFAFTFVLGVLMTTIGTSLGFLVVYYGKDQAPPHD